MLLFHAWVCSDLGLHPDLLKSISKDQSKVEDRLKEVLRNWLRKDSMDSDKKPTWSHLAAALKPINCAPSFNIIAKELSNLGIYIFMERHENSFFYMRLAKLSLLL